MSTLATRLRLQFIATITGTDADFDSAGIEVQFPFPSDATTDGSGLDQASKVYRGSHTLLTTASNTHDLYGGLADPFGVTLNFTRIVGIALWNTSVVAGDNLTIGAAASNKWESWTTVTGSTEKVGPNGLWLKWEPSLAAMAVASGSTDNLKVENPGANSVTYRLMVVGS